MHSPPLLPAAGGSADAPTVQPGPRTRGSLPVSLRPVSALATLMAVCALVGCGSTADDTVNRDSQRVDPTPEKIDGTPSYEFEEDDIDAAEGASDAVKDYCAGAVSEAQRIGCEAHVTENEIP